MAIEAVKVPADVSVEEKIIGPIGLRQLFILLGGGGISYVIFSFISSSGLGLGTKLLAWLPLVIAACFAFFKINDISLLKLIFLQIEKMDKPQVRTFGPRPGISINLRTSIEPEKEANHKTQNASNTDFVALSTALDTGPQQLAGTTVPAGLPAPAADGENDMALGALDEIEPQAVRRDRVEVTPLDGPTIDQLFNRSAPADDSDDLDPPSVFRDLLPPQHS